MNKVDALLRVSIKLLPFLEHLSFVMTHLRRYFPYSHVGLSSSTRDKSSPSSGKIEVFPGHVTQVQTCDYTNVKVEDYSPKEG